MARIRSIKPELPQSESMGNVSREARLCFILLFTISDDHGKLRGNSRMLASLLYPYDNDALKLIDKWLTELEGQHCITRYTIDAASYILIENWSQHQKVDKPSRSKIPDPREDSRVRHEPSRGVVAGSEDQGEDQGRDQGSKDNGRVTLNELSVDHIQNWLAEKRSKGEYVYHDEHRVLELFKDYCLSKGKTYKDYIAAYRSAFTWEKCHPKESQNGNTRQPTTHHSQLSKTERAKAAVLRAAVAGGYANAQPRGETGAGDGHLSVLSSA
jgi:hypothetical protein